MEINFNADDFAGWIRQICDSKLTVNENEYIYAFRDSRSHGNNSRIELTLDKSKLNSIIESLSKFSVVDQTIISNDYTFETLVREEGSPSKKLGTGQLKRDLRICVFFVGMKCTFQHPSLIN